MITIKTSIEGQALTIQPRYRYVIFAREIGALVSSHSSFKTANEARQRKQPFWFRKIYETKEPITLYVYRREPGGLRWLPLDEEGSEIRKGTITPTTQDRAA